MNNKSIKFGLLGGALEGIYISLVGLFFVCAQDWFSGPSVFPMILMLMIFVFSAAVSGLLVLGYPLYLALQKKYKEAISTVLISLALIFILMVVCFIFYLLL